MRTQDEREKFENLLNEAPDKINAAVPVPGNIPEELQSAPIIGVDLDDLREKCNTEARTMITNAVAFIIPADMLDENEYIKNKIEVDVMSLAGMIFQLRANEAVQKSMIEEINRGFINPRMYEVFGQISKVVGEINKQLLQTVEAIKMTYQSIKSDVKEKRNDALGPGQENPLMIGRGDGSMITMGSKELIKNINERPRPDREIIQDISSL